MEFADIIKTLIDQNNRLAIHYGEVTAITNSSGKYLLTDKPSGSSTAITNVRYLRSYVPRVGDIVMIQINKSDMVVIDALASADKSLNPVAYRPSNLTILEDIDTYVTFQDVANDEWGMWDAGAATVLTCKVPGRYQATAQVLWEGQNSGYCSLFIEKGTQEIARQDDELTTKEHGMHMSVTSVPFTMAINDTVRMGVHHDTNPDNDLIISSGGVDHTGFFNALSVIYLGP
jgi:hypothetical protein